MNVDERTAFALLKGFSHLEYALKMIPRFIRGGIGEPAMVQWNQVYGALVHLDDHLFFNTVPDWAREKLLRDPDRPMKLLVKEDARGDRYAQFDLKRLEERHPAAVLLEASTRVRNNLFHGGKESHLQEHQSGDDQVWAEAALAVVESLLVLTARKALK